MPNRIERSTTAGGSLRTADVAAPATQTLTAAAQTGPVKASTSTKPRDGMGPTQTGELRKLQPDGKPVAGSASPHALWADDDVVPTTEAWAAMSIESKRNRVESVRAERDALGKRIDRRVKVLQGGWQRVRTSSKSEALRDYQERSRSLRRETATRLDGKLDDAEALQRRINRLRARAETLASSRDATPSQRKERQLVADQLKDLQRRQDLSIREAVDLVEDAGLTVDLYAHLEHVIDPSSPELGSGQSLLDQVTRFLQLDHFLGWVLKDTPALALEKTETKKRNEREHEARLDHERLQERVQRQVRVERRTEADRPARRR